ncbi:MAG TPA: isochorismate synthase [Flavobacteriaceae bacterium]|nr:isochorismate synthase [Flavobacteriaceae bacterium]
MNSKDIFIKAADYLEQALPFVLYSKPVENTGKLIVDGLFQENNHLYFAEDYTESGFVMAPFDLKAQKSVLIPAENATVLRAKINRTDDFIDENLHRPLHDENNDKLKHIDLVKRGIQNIQEGKFQKVVLSRKLIADKRSTIIAVFKRLLHHYPTAFAYCWYHPKIGLWMGATPETLVKIEDHLLKTMALASTKAVNGTNPPEWTSKEIEEHQYVIDFIEDTLKDNVRDLKIGKVGNIQAGKLWHLKCDISGEMKSVENLKMILEDIHPTPAVCGMPKEAAKNFILKEENYNREFYTGFLGELNLKSNQQNTTNLTELYVNLRCMQIKEKNCEIYVGGGIVKDSDPISEWQETVNKSRTMLDMI